jgi:16S rRNA (guanine527-N7)-methyltransferase
MSMEALVAEAAAFGLQLDAEQQAQFGRYATLLQTWNRRLSLTTIDDLEGIRIRHFLDGLTCATVTGDLNGKRLVDVGSGAGFPGLPLKILYPELALTLVESVSKKVHFLEEVVRELGLAGVSICDERAETLGQDPAHRERYDWATARAVAALRVLVEYTLPLCRVGGHVLAQKGESARDEAAAAAEALSVLGGGPPSFHPIALPGREITHYLVVIPKVAATPVQYPRRPGRPAKRPL